MCFGLICDLRWENRICVGKLANTQSKQQNSEKQFEVSFYRAGSVVAAVVFVSAHLVVFFQLSEQALTSSPDELSCT